MDVPQDRVFFAFDAYLKAIQSGAVLVILATPPVLPGPDGGYEHAVPVPGVYKPY